MPKAPYIWDEDSEDSESIRFLNLLKAVCPKYIGNAGSPDGSGNPMKIEKKLLNPHAPVAQKVAEEVVFRRFQGEGIEFFF